MESGSRKVHTLGAHYRDLCTLNEVGETCYALGADALIIAPMAGSVPAKPMTANHL